MRLGKMNLAVHGLAGDIRQGNTYYEDLHRSTGKFDFVMANPPFNVDRVDKDRLKDDPRFPFGLPRTDNANYLWIQLFYSALTDTGRAGFVMANSASDARGSELEIRKQLIEARAVDVMVAVGSNFFYTVTLPCTLWFFDRGKRKTARADQVLFIDARHLYRQIDRAHRDWTPAQIEFLANIARLYRGESRREPARQRRPAGRTLPRWQIRRRGRAVQGGDAGRDRSPGLEPQPRPLCGRGRPRGGRLRLQGAAGGAERGTGNPQRRGPGTGRADCGECGEVAGGGVMTGKKRDLVKMEPVPPVSSASASGRPPPDDRGDPPRCRRHGQRSP